MPDIPWRIAAASVIGASHEVASLPCQDVHRVMLITTGTDPLLVVAVADGAGSASHAETGARVAVAAICELIAAWSAGGGNLSQLNWQGFSGWIDGVREQIAETASQTDGQMRDYACTLLVAVVGEGHAAFGQLGDGAIVVLTPEKEWSWVFWPQHGPYANTTYFVTDDTALDQFEFEVGERRIDEIGMFTDGLEQLVLNLQQRTVHEPFFKRMLYPLRRSNSVGMNRSLSEHLASYLSSPAVRERADDDVTLVLASRAENFEPAGSELANAGSDAGAH
jgi:hypothetical protein